jgi:hypothetical protein
MRYACAYQGIDAEGSEQAMDAGLWDHPLIDPMTVHVGGLFTPIGPWATCKSVQDDSFLQYPYFIQHRTLIKTRISNTLDC